MNKNFFNALEDVEFVSASAIIWNRTTTRTIDLTVMMENEMDSKNTRLSDMPNNALLSFEREKVKIGEQTMMINGKKAGAKNKDPNLDRIDLNRNLLQVTVNSQIIIFDLGEPQPKEKLLFNATN